MNEITLPLSKDVTNLKGVIYFGAICTFIALTGTIIDIIFGTITGGNLAELPQTASDRFIQMQSNPLLGLYSLDLLNPDSALEIFSKFMPRNSNA